MGVAAGATTVGLAGIVDRVTIAGLVATVMIAGPVGIAATVVLAASARAAKSRSSLLLS
jgi:hypothetical protein